MYFIGIDLGATKIEAMLICLSDSKTNIKSLYSFELAQQIASKLFGEILYKKRCATDKHLGYAQILENISNLVQESCQFNSIKLTEIAGLALSIPAPIDPNSNIINISNTSALIGRKITEDLKAKLKLNCPIFMANDANCFLVAEALCGAGLKYYHQSNIPIHMHNAIGLILGSGLGGAIIVQGKILTGKHGCSGEIGHVSLYYDGPQCYCGRYGCAEQYLSGPALEDDFLMRSATKLSTKVTAEEIFTLAAQQNFFAQQSIEQYIKNLALHITNLVNIIDPHYFVLGGGLSLQDSIYGRLEKILTKNTWSKIHDIKCVKHEISDSAGALGAVLLLINQ